LFLCARCWLGRGVPVQNNLCECLIGRTRVPEAEKLLAARTVTD
jgi:hypothetical protein